MVVVSWWWSAVYNMSYFVTNTIIFYIRDRNLFFAFVVLVWVLLGSLGGMSGFGMGGVGAGGLRGPGVWIWGCG